jgi:hypothetical protein
LTNLGAEEPKYPHPPTTLPGVGAQLITFPDAYTVLPDTAGKGLVGQGVPVPVFIPSTVDILFWVYVVGVCWRARWRLLVCYAPLVRDLALLLLQFLLFEITPELKELLA